LRAAIAKRPRNSTARNTWVVVSSVFIECQS
jgi:hypothetical protein